MPAANTRLDSAIDTYKGYLIWQVADSFYNASKPGDPAKGITVTGESEEEIRQEIDKVLARVKQFHINVYTGPEVDIIVNNPYKFIKCFDGHWDYRILVVSNKDYEYLEQLFDNKLPRRSRKHKKNTTTLNRMRQALRNCTFLQKTK